MKIGCSVVLYRPDDSAVERLSQLSLLFSPVIVLDNSSERNEKVLEKTQKDKNILYFPFGENKGIAFALNKALDVADQEKCEFLLTLDQDSTYPYSSQSSVLKELSHLDLSEDAILALTTKAEYEKHPSNGFSYVKDAITSGNFLNLPLLKEKKIRFEDKLFIDYVDFDFDEKIISAGLRIKQLHGIYLEHTIGNPLTRHFFFKKIYCMNHRPIRYYYRFRNAYYLYHRNRKYYRHLYFHTMVIDKWKMYLYEPDKKAKKAMIRQGIKDAKKGILGTYSAK